jgi:hypothetical protein
MTTTNDHLSPSERMQLAQALTSHLLRSLSRVEDARAGLEHAQAVCDRWTKMFGLRVWREGHPADRQKLYERRRAKRRLAYELRRLDEALLAVPPAGGA